MTTDRQNPDRYGADDEALVRVIAEALAADANGCEVSHKKNWRDDDFIEPARRVAAQLEFIGWTWPHAHLSDSPMFLPNDGGYPPQRQGVRRVYAPAHNKAVRA